MVEATRGSQVRLSTIAEVVGNVGRYDALARDGFVVKCDGIMSATNSMFQSLISTDFHVLGNNWKQGINHMAPSDVITACLQVDHPAAELGSLQKQCYLRRHFLLIP